MSAERLARAPWCVLGAGRAGVAFATLLSRAGADVAVWTRSERRAESARRALGLAVHCGNLPAFDGARRWLLCTPDSVIPRLSAALRPHEDSLILHCAGSLPASAMAAAWSGRRAACHPLQSLRGVPEDLEALEGAFFAVDGEGEARACAVALAESAGGNVGVIPSEAKAAYHAAAVVASQGVTALLHMIESWSQTWGIEDDALRQGMASLASQSALNAGALGATQAATGPVVRGDGTTIAHHMKALSGVHAFDLEFYDQVQRRMLSIAEERGVDPTALASIRSALERQSET